MPRWTVRLEQITQIQNFHAPSPLIRHLEGDLLGIRRQAELHWIPSPWERKGMHPPIQTVRHHRESAATPLGDRGQVTTVPAQGGGAVGLVTAQLRNRHHGSVDETAQLHRGPAPAVADDCEPFTTATQGWGLLTAAEQGATGPFTATVAAHQHHAGEQDQQRATQLAQSSKRELLSRGLPEDGRELRGGWRLLLGRFEARGGSEERLGSLEALGLALGRLRFGVELLGLELRLGVKAASSAPDGAGSPAGRSGRPMGRLPRR